LTDGPTITITLRPQGEVGARFGLGRDRIQLQVAPGCTIGELLAAKGVPPGEVWVCARNGVLAKPDERLADGDLLEVISPVAGGR
jgi:sulfur carrier protein ThiS